MAIKRVELEGLYNITIENDAESESTSLGVDNWSVMFQSKQDVVDYINLLNKALEFWEYD